MVRISVAMATYNGAYYVREQLQSIIEQTVDVDEIVICDDCSIDNTVDIIRDLFQGGKITYHIVQHDINKGVIKSFEDAMALCTGDIIILADQDDVWLKTKVEHIIDVYAKDRPNVILTDAYIVDRDLKISTTLWKTLHFNSQKATVISKDVIITEMIKRNIFTGMCMAIDKEFFQKCDKCPTIMLHDEWYGWNAICLGKVQFVPLPLAKYRQHSTNVIGSGKYSRITSFKNARLKICDSSMLKKMKCDFLMSSFEDVILHKKIIDAMAFYEWRTRIRRHDSRDLIRCINFFVKLSYYKYTSGTENALWKDLFLILL